MDGSNFTGRVNGENINRNGGVETEKLSCRDAPGAWRSARVSRVGKSRGHTFRYWPTPVQSINCLPKSTVMGINEQSIVNFTEKFLQREIYINIFKILKI